MLNYISDLYISDLYILDLYISDLYILDCIYIMTYYNPILSELKLKISYVPSDTHLEESLEMTLDNSLLSIGKNIIEITDTPIKDKLNNADPTLNIKPTLIAKYANNLVTTTDGNIFNNLITPVITFPTEFVTSLTYGSNYVFYPAIISNNSPLQSITYSIINSSTLNTPVASIISGANTTHPVIQINSSGTFQIQAKCNDSSDGYKGVTKISNLITISKKHPVINFLPNNFPLLINYNTDPILFPISAPLATLTYNTGQTITYSIVYIDGVTPSTIATISFDGSYLVKNSVGSFRILASVSSNTNYDLLNVLSEIITIQKSTPTITKLPTIPSSFAYGTVFTIPSDILYAITTSNTDTPGPAISYSSSDSSVATISEGMTITINGLGEFQITVTIGVTPNYNQAIYTLPSTYTSVKATPVIRQYPQINLIAPVTEYTLVYGQSYTINPDPSQISTITSNTDTSPSPNISYTSSDETVATISGSNVTIVGIGYFQILTTVGSTKNYNQILQSPSPQIYYTIQAIPTINSFPTTTLSAQKWVYGQSYSEIIPIANNIPTTNTDTNATVISYSTSDATIATISGNTITIVGVGNFQILVSISNTTNFSAITYNYPTINSYYTSIQATPTITFPSNFETSSIYGSTYIFVPAIISNNNPSQVIRYSSSDTMVATLNYNPESIYPSVVIHSIGTFQIIASCYASTNGFYSAAFISSPVITISEGYPNITFNTNILSNEYNYNSTYTYTFSETYPIASITNNTGQTLTYSAVNTDGSSPSTVASISSNGTSLTTISVGSFKILVTAAATLNYGEMSMLSQTITIVSITPTVITFPTLPSSFIYGNTYTIPSTITTTNTDIQSVNFVYSTIDTSIATISGNTITIVGVGNFQISVTIESTANYNEATYPFPSTYTSIQATPIISPFPSNFGSTWVINGTYNLTSTVTTNTGSGYSDSNEVTYSIINQNVSNPNVSNIATITTSGSGSQITINNIGTFQIQASLAAAPNFTAAAPVQSNTITIVASNVYILPNIFPSFVYGETYNLPANPTNNTDTNSAPTITYGISTPQTGSIGTGTINGNSLTTTAAGGAYLYVNITATENFNADSIIVSINIAKAMQIITLNKQFFNYNTHYKVGEDFDPMINYGDGGPILSNNNTDITTPNYSITNIVTTVGGDVASIYVLWNNTVMIYINSPGIFYYQIEAPETANFYGATVNTPNFYVSILPEIIIFNNPQTFPPSASTSGEVGLAICIPTNSYPLGFNNYSSVTITNETSNVSITFDSTTTPTYSSILSNYLVFFEPESQGQLSQVLSTSTASNIAYVAINGIATGMSSGQYIGFTFTGLISGEGPSELNLVWTPPDGPGLDITQGFVYNSYYSITSNGNYPNQSYPYGEGTTVNVSIPPNSFVNNFIVPWAGYNTSSITGGVQALNQYTSIQQAWGVWGIYAAESQPTYGTPAQYTTQNGETYYYYVGIPQIINPIMFS